MYFEKGLPVVADGQFVVVASGDLMPRFVGMHYAYGHHFFAVLAVGKEQCQAGIRMLCVARAGETYISVEAQADDDGSLLNLYRTFARLRNTYPVLAQGKMVKHPVYNDGNTSQQSIAAWYRELDGERMLVVHNFGQETQILTLTDQPDKAVGVSGEVKLQRGDASSKLLMGAWSSVVFAL